MKVKDTWEEHYNSGGNSGRGSYNEHFTFKTNVINDIINKYEIKSVTDFGCGDGNQISKLNFEKYTGLDISQKAVNLCEEKHSGDKTKTFSVYDSNYTPSIKTDITMSLDVIYHIFEDDLYLKYIDDLIKTSNKYVLIYSSNYNDDKWQQHVRHRKFDEALPKNLELVQKIDTIFDDCSADFYLYKIINAA
jgi:SAM-dependent methyltransferase